MKKIGIVFVAAFVVATLFVAGCGGKKPVASNNAKDLLKKSQTKMKSVKSMKINGNYSVETPEAETKKESASFVAEIKRLGKDDADAHMTMTPESGKAEEMFMVGGYAYNNDPASGWTKTKVGSSSDLQKSGVVTPDMISDMSKFAQNMRLDPEEGGKYVIAFDVGSMFFEQMLDQAASSATAQGSSPDGDATKKQAQAMKDMLKGLKMALVYKMDKKSLLADSAVVTASLNGSAFGNVKFDMTTTFSDYNAPVSITLPPEAQNAKEIQPGPGGVPGVPGMGF
ncbi:MAG: hypothetical protein CVT63_00970 [Candidatus Anoxymicrobium japonicum]|uniref:Lipoprotein n=1 Tax=Candidatus Anoxymicrobium japonicum TaxID=2013648 RepID=A0A2N3G7T0_9ACTN|nr:MAG: hypothetical protein CVT63_00970 [Candidatus Anoxymicrobium japonicum]